VQVLREISFSLTKCLENHFLPFSPQLSGATRLGARQGTPLVLTDTEALWAESPLTFAVLMAASAYREEADLPAPNSAQQGPSLGQSHG